MSHFWGALQRRASGKYEKYGDTKYGDTPGNTGNTVTRPEIPEIQYGDTPVFTDILGSATGCSTP
jgi:hypothetical protein